MPTNYIEDYLNSGSTNSYLREFNQLPWLVPPKKVSENYFDMLSLLSHKELVMILSKFITITYQEKERRLYLIPSNLKNRIPENYPFILSSGETVLFKRNEEERHRLSFYGCYDFGIIRVDKRRVSRE